MNQTKPGVLRTAFQDLDLGTWSRPLIHGCGLILILAIFAIKYSQKKPKKSVVKRDINANRKYGHWTPDLSFKTPTPPPFPNWDINTTRPQPYRAFRHKYSITMAIRNMDFHQWIELDNEWLKFHNHKLERTREKKDELCVTSPEARDAAFELLDELWNYLPHRYPTLFKQTATGLDNLVTGESWSFRNGTQEDPMYIVAMLLQDDVAIMIEQEDGQYVLKGGAIMLAGFWRLKDKYNLPLSAIHTTGDVPKYKEKLQTGMEKFFIRQTCDKPVVRNNYFIQTDGNLPWSKSIGDEDKEVVGWYTAEPAKDINQLYFRSERQSLRRLPKTGATIFTIRTYFLPITELAQEPYVPRRLLDGIRSWIPEVQDYRGYTKFKDVVEPYLEKMADEQEAKGYTVETEPDVYPY